MVGTPTQRVFVFSKVIEKIILTKPSRKLGGLFLGVSPQGEATDCNSVRETYAWFDSKDTHHRDIAQLVRAFA